jgi:hypothetical protein
VNPYSTILQLDTVVPLAAEWAAEEESRILRDGVPLSETEIAAATAIGIREPHRVRVLQVEAIPIPSHPVLKAAAAAIDSVTRAPRGLTLQYGIFIRSDSWRDPWLLIHELVHTAQYERLGGFVPFLRRYLFECASNGYRTSSLEQEADTVADLMCGRAATLVSPNFG